MRQRNEIITLAPVLHPEGPADDLVEFFDGKELRDGQFANGDNEARPENLKFVVHPTCAVADFVGRGNTIATGGSLAREATADGGEVDPLSHIRFTKAAEFLEPTE